ncbi:MAG: MBL fold metallo-hydrolase [Bacteroidales bacterium]|nr:MBL fold metallo-hydrolase [Bacteroidales bacterium]
MKITFLGTGTSQGVPVIACQCRVCLSKDSRDKRLRSSVMIEEKGNVLVIDSGPDFRQQMLRHNVKNLDAIIFTHEHKDHVAGLDDVRAFNFILKRPMDVYAEKRVQDALQREFMYIFSDHKYPGIPDIKMHMLNNSEFSVAGIRLLPIRVYHHELPVFGFRINSFAYITDLNRIPDEEIKKLEGVKYFAISALRIKPHVSHFCLQEALDVIQKIKPEKAYLTHISHQFGLHAEVELSLPEHVRLAYDGLEIDI